MKWAKLGISFSLFVRIQAQAQKSVSWLLLVYVSDLLALVKQPYGGAKKTWI